MKKNSAFFVYIVEQIHTMDIAGYLKEEVISLCNHLHYFKLKNIVENYEMFKSYLLFLDNHNTKQIALLQKFQKKPQQESDYNKKNVLLDYYISKQGQTLINLQENSPYILHNLTSFATIQAIKGFLVLTIDEFCNASSTRIAIKKLHQIPSFFPKTTFSTKLGENNKKK